MLENVELLFNDETDVVHSLFHVTQHDFSRYESENNIIISTQHQKRMLHLVI